MYVFLSNVPFAAVLCAQATNFVRSTNTCRRTTVAATAMQKPYSTTKSDDCLLNDTNDGDFCSLAVDIVTGAG
jgi:hypothetical protein